MQEKENKTKIKWTNNKIMKGSFHWKECCFLCNNWILENEDFYLIIIPTEIRKKYSSLENFIVHTDEWTKFSKDLSDIELAEKLLSYRKPKRKPLTEEEKQDIEYFKQASEYFGFNKYILSKNKRFVKMKKRKTSLTLIYDLVFKRFSYDINAREGLFGGIFLRELVAKVSNKFYELKGIDVRDDYTANKTLKGINEQINKLIN